MSPRSVKYEYSDLTRKSSLLVAAGDFGWGSGGKLRLILNRLSDLTAVALDGIHTVSVAEVDRFVRPADLRTLVSERRLGVGLVVGLPSIVKPLQDSGLAVIFVDSLPYLWTQNDEIAMTADEYLAQQ